MDFKNGVLTITLAATLVGCGSNQDSTTHFTSDDLSSAKPNGPESEIAKTETTLKGRFKINPKEPRGSTEGKMYFFVEPEIEKRVIKKNGEEALPCQIEQMSMLYSTAWKLSEDMKTVSFSGKSEMNLNNLMRLSDLQDYRLQGKWENSEGDGSGALMVQNLVLVETHEEGDPVFTWTKTCSLKNEKKN